MLNNPRRQSSKELSRCGILVAIALSAANTVLGQPTVGSFKGLGDLPAGDINSEAVAVSADRSTVVGVGSSALGREGFRWTLETGMVGLGDLAGGQFLSSALDVSADGSVVVGLSRSGAGVQAFRWTQETGMVGLGDLPGGAFFSRAGGVSGDGSVVVGFSESLNGSEAFRWTEATGMVGLGDLPGGGFGSQASGVSADGLVVTGTGGSLLAANEPFRWTQAAGMVGLGHLPGSRASAANDISADGLVIVGFSTTDNPGGSTPEAFRWTQGTGMVGLGEQSMALAVSADGSVVVGAGGGAFLWDAVNGLGSVRDILVSDFGLDLTGWTLTFAEGVSDDGRLIVGQGINPSGLTEAWMATLPLSCTKDADCSDGTVCTQEDRCIKGRCQHMAKIYGDVDMFDLFCILNCFSNDFNVCSFNKCDLEPCEGDADVDLFDLFAVLNAFSGDDPCCGG